MPKQQRLCPRSRPPRSHEYLVKCWEVRRYETEYMVEADSRKAAEDLVFHGKGTLEHCALDCTISMEVRGVEEGQ